MSVQAVPQGFHTLTPHLVIDGAAKAIEFYKKAFGAVEMYNMTGPDGKVMNAAMMFGDSIIMLCDEHPGMGVVSPLALGGSAVRLHLYLPDADAIFAQAVAAGAVVTMPLENMFWGDRYGTVKDPFGHEWGIATHIEDVTPEEMAARVAKLFGGACPGT